MKRKTLKTVSIRERAMAYQDIGTGPAVLLGHSYLWDSSMWRPQIEALSSRYRLIAPDLWAHGQSDTPPPGPLTISSMAADLLQFADALGLETFSVAGLSVGGMWGCQLALNAPQRVRSLIILNSYVGPEPQDLRLKYLSMLDTVNTAGRIPPAMQETIVPLFFSPVTQSAQPELVEDFLSRLSEFDSDRIPSIVAIGRAIFERESLLEQLNRLPMPALFIAGEHDLSRPPHESSDMASRIPNSQLEVIPQAGHISSLEQPGLVNDRLTRFLASLNHDF